MAEKILVIKEKLDHSGIFDFKAVYGFTHRWLTDEGFGVVEDKYSEKVSGNAREINIKWKASKQLSEYFKIEIEIEEEIGDLTDVEVEIDGARKKMNKGNFKVEFKGALILDPESKWDISAFYKFLRDIYNKYVIPKRVKDMGQEVRKAVWDLKEEIKAFLELSGRRMKQ